LTIRGPCTEFDRANSGGYNCRSGRITIEALQVLALETGPENSSFSVEDALKAAFEKLAALDVRGNENFKLEMTSTPSVGNTVIGDRRLIEKAFFGILHEVLYCRDEVVARVNVTDQLVDGSPGVGIDFYSGRKWHWCSLEAGFTGYQIAQRGSRSFRPIRSIGRDLRTPSNTWHNNPVVTTLTRSVCLMTWARALI